MIFDVPASLTDELEVVGLVDDLRTRLRWRLTEPRRWVGTMRRETFARAVQGSNSIEGYDASLDDVAAVLDDEPPLDADTETRLALEGYRDAMTYVLQLAREPHLDIDQSLIKALHFMMLRHDLNRHPGRWRPGSVYVQRESDREIVYEGPDADDVSALMGELVADLGQRDDVPALIRAAMAHLNLVMIHPFSDGNGRMARCLQTLALTREQILTPEFNSIEEYLGRNTPAYYDVLAEVGRGAWHPDRDPRPWVRFCLTAHYRQATTLLRRVAESEQLWEELTQLVAERGVPTRAVGPLFDAAHGHRLRNAAYRTAVTDAEGDEITDQTASRDLKALVDAGLLDAIGERRGRIYAATPVVRDVWGKVRASRKPRGTDDPFMVIRERRQTKLAL